MKPHSPDCKNLMAFLYRRAAIVWFSWMIFSAVSAQTTKPGSISSDTTHKHLYKTYMSSIGGSANLYNGTEYTASYPFTVGSPFWDTAGFRPGIICYEGVVYKDIPIAYDLVSNEVIIKGYQQLSIKLDASKINFFLAGNHLFVRLNGDSYARNMLPPDIYDLVYNGTIKLYVKRKKQAERVFNPEDPYRIAAYNSFFILKDSTYYQVANRNALLNLFRDKSDAIKTFWKENNLNFKTDAEKTIVQTINYYTQLKGGLAANTMTDKLTVQELLQQMFPQTSYQSATSSSEQIDIAKQLPLQPTLPDDFFDRATSVKDTASLARPVMEVPKEKIKAAAENKLYEIGNRSLQSKDKVTLAGYVRDIKNGEPIPSASIYIDSLSVGVLTDQFGYYSFTLPTGRHQMQVTSVGMKNTRRQIMLYTDGQLNIELAEYIPSLKEVVVTAARTSNTRSVQMGVNKLTIKTIKQVPVVFGEADVLKVVLTLPGVTSVGEASTGFNVRGGSADQNLIILNDLTIYNPSHLFGFFSAFNPDVVKGVELYKSAIPEKYGGRLSSVLDVTTKEGNSKKIAGTGGIGPLTSKLTIEGPIVKDKSSFIASGRSSYSNWLLSKIRNSAYSNSRASFYDVDLHISHTVNAKNNLYLNGYISNDQFKLNNDTLYKYGNKNLNLKWKHIFNNKLHALFTGGFDHYQYKVSSESNPVNAYKLAFDISQANLRTDFTYSHGVKHVFRFGLTSIYYKLSPGSFEPQGQQSLVIKDKLQQEQALETAVYLGDEYTITPDLSINAGLRYSVFNYLGPHDQYNYAPGFPRSTNTMIDTVRFEKGKIIQTYHNPEFRFTLRYSLSETSSIKFGFNTLRQYIHMLSNTNAISPTDVWKLSDAYIKPQSGNQLSAGFYKNFRSNTIETSIEVYYKQMKNYLDYKSGAALILNHHIETDIISSKGKAYGAELLIRKLSGKLNGWLSYSYSRILLQSNDAQAGEAVNSGKYYPANHDKPHNANLIANYRFSHRYSISLGVNYSTGRPVTLPLAIFDFAGGQRIYYSDRNTHRIPDYFRADLSFMIEGNHKLKKLTHNSWSFGVYNLTARKNAYSVYFIQENGFVKGYQLSIFGTIIPFVTYNFRF